jgi:hypothetical protein
LKSILYDEYDPRYEEARAVMVIVKKVGNPNRLAENAQSAVLIKLGNSLRPYTSQLQNIGAYEMVRDLLNANQVFIDLEQACREIIADKKLNKMPSLGAIRKELDAVYRTIIGYINGIVRLPQKQEAYKEFLNEMNVLVKKYDNLILARKSEKKEKVKEDKPCGCGS